MNVDVKVDPFFRLLKKLIMLLLHQDQYGYPISKYVNDEPVIKDIKMHDLPYLKEEVRALIMWIKDNKES